MIGSLQIASKLVIMGCVATLGIVAVAWVGLFTLRQNLLDDRKIQLEELVEVVGQAVGFDRQAAIEAGLSEADASQRAKTMLRSLHFGKDDYFYATSMDGVAQAHPNLKVEGKNFIDVKDADGVFFAREQIELVRSKGSGFVTFRFPRAGGGEPVPKITYVTEFKPYGWLIGAGVYLDDVDGIFWSQIARNGALIGVTLLLLAAVSVALGRSIVKPISGITEAMCKLAEGDTATAIPARDRTDEVGAMARSVEVFQVNMIETARLRSEQEALKLEGEVGKKALMERMADDFQHGVRASLDALDASAAKMRIMSQSMSATAEDTSQQATTVAVAAELATANAQTVAAATEELSSSVSEISRQVAQSTEIAARAVAEASRTNLTVQGLSAAAQKIGDVVRLIGDVASQTDLLALNATIEAARAGEAGRGFAVVASEVKCLASQTATATREIAAQVAAIQEVTDKAVEAIEGIAGTIAEINEIATAIASAVEEQDTATREIARNVVQAAKGTSEVSQTTGVNRSVSQTDTVADQVLLSAEELSRQSCTLRADIDEFLARIRAA